MSFKLYKGCFSGARNHDLKQPKYSSTVECRILFNITGDLVFKKNNLKKKGDSFHWINLKSHRIRMITCNTILDWNWSSAPEKKKCMKLIEKNKC